MITKEAVLAFQRKWSEKIIDIGNMHQDKGDFYSATTNFISNLYAYDSEPVLFKPTLASDNPFRLTKEAALSYFIGGNPNYSEDIGFALKNWTNIVWKNSGISIIDKTAICMGHYFFTNKDGELKVEFSIVLHELDDGKLKIILHDSHLPYQK
tara:strand:+ start:838 stop:1296 length:459 start_codon:yes stop_codon:yes gene_type:complete